ncbi:22200_t:CDS:1 [Dentiscutata erythropus]|uniref:22200_t:CDS:1 n=1 Tax=Dentiscutata erythropus TaxID=1348616 RepID=A0A9N9ASW9_9GLOM|nr:22200_t:CDS:1 [Dentiscutata erythropus]
MLAWLKKCLNHEKHESFCKSLFYWRKPNNKTSVKDDSNDSNDSHFYSIIPVNFRNFFQNDNFEHYDHITKSLKQGQMIPYLFYRLQKLLFICLIQEIFLSFLVTYVPTVPSQPYPVRIFNYFVNNNSSQPFISYFDLFYSYTYAGFLYINMSWLYEICLFCSSLIFCGILHYDNVSKNRDVKLENDNIFYKGLMVVKQWLISFLFETPKLFDIPYLSSSPKDFWNKRWQQMYRQSFSELAYKPTFDFTFASLIPLFSNNVFNSFKVTSTKVIEKNAVPNYIKNIIFLIAHSCGVFASFFLSGLFHEYVLLGLFGICSGEQMGFFLLHAVVMIIWEGIGIMFGSKQIKQKVSNDKKDWEKKDEKDQMYKNGSSNTKFGIRFLQFIIWNSILIFSTPLMMEPYIRTRLFSCAPRLYCLI